MKNKRVPDLVAKALYDMRRRFPLEIKQLATWATMYGDIRVEDILDAGNDQLTIIFNVSTRIVTLIENTYEWQDHKEALEAFSSIEETAMREFPGKGECEFDQDGETIWILSMDDCFQLDTTGIDVNMMGELSDAIKKAVNERTRVWNDQIIRLKDRLAFIDRCMGDYIQLQKYLEGK